MGNWNKKGHRTIFFFRSPPSLYCISAYFSVQFIISIKYLHRKSARYFFSSSANFSLPFQQQLSHPRKKKETKRKKFHARKNQRNNKLWQSIKKLLAKKLHKGFKVLVSRAPSAFWLPLQMFSQLLLPNTTRKLQLKYQNGFFFV